MEQHSAEPDFTPSRADRPGGPPSRAPDREGHLVPALAASALAKSYHAGLSGCTARVQALRHVDLRVEQGEAVGLLGPAGSGKSTLLLCLAGVLQPDNGSLSWFGRGADEGGPPPGVAYVSQHRSSYPFMTVREAVEYHAMLRDTAVADRAAAVEAALEDTGLGPMAGALVGTIPHPGAARLAIAQALAGRPRVLLLDETLSGLLPSERRDIAVIVRRLADRAMTVVVATEAMEVLDGIASRIAIMLDGRIAAIVTPSTLRGTRMLELTIATSVEPGRPFGTRVAEEPRRQVLRLPLDGTTAEAILARCQACGIRVITSRIIVARDGLCDPGRASAIRGI